MRREPRVFLVNPANVTAGISFITPRWLFVLAAATPRELVGDPALIDETIERFNPDKVERGDIVGIGITTDNCLAGYRVAREAKKRGATVIMGGIHTTLFPEEVRELGGADAVVKGNADMAWGTVITDVLNHRLKRHYEGGRLPGEQLLAARWDLMDRSRYLFPSVQTVAGCIENCTFCSVWVTEGRIPRQRLVDKVIEEVNVLNRMNFPAVMFADDIFNPAVRGRIEREASPSKRKELERIREERLAFFDEYDRRVERTIPSFVQMTSEIASDPEYLKAVHEKMGVHGALIGVESFNAAALKSIRKEWNPVGQKMIEAIRTVQDAGIQVLSSIICGLETDTPETLEEMRQFALASETRFAQFTRFQPFPGTVDFLEMVQDRKHKTSVLPFAPKHRSELLEESYWLNPDSSRAVVKHPSMSYDVLSESIRKSWDAFYRPSAIVRRARKTPWSFWPKVILVMSSLGFRAFYGGRGISADSVRKNKLGWFPRLLLRTSARILRMPMLCKAGRKPTRMLERAA